jgi:hypothetical protein
MDAARVNSIHQTKRDSYICSNRRLKPLVMYASFLQIFFRLPFAETSVFWVYFLSPHPELAIMPGHIDSDMHKRHNSDVQ